MSTLASTLAQTLAAGRLVVTYTGDPSGHITLVFKGWSKQTGRRICPLGNAQRLYVNAHGLSFGQRGYSVGKVELDPTHPKAGLLIEDRFADAARLQAARYILDAAREQGPTDNILIGVHCLRCGKALTDPVSIERNLGPECFGKHTGSKAAPVVPFEWPAPVDQNLVAQVGAEYAAMAAQQHDRVVDYNDTTGDFTIKFPYNPVLVADLKNSVRGRKWNKDNKCWTAPLKAADSLNAFAGQHGFHVTEDAQEAIEDGAGAPFGEAKLNGPGTIVLTFDYDPTVVAAVKSLPTRERQWDNQARAWLVQVSDTTAPGLVSIFGMRDFAVASEVQMALRGRGGVA